MDLGQQEIAFIGAGNMANGLIGGLLAGGLAPERIHVADPAPEQLEVLRARHAVQTHDDNRRAIEVADIVVLAVKPQVMGTVLAELGDAMDEKRRVVISVAAGISIATLEAAFGPHMAVIRIMPNAPALIGCGAIALFANPACRDADRLQAQQLAEAVGLSIWVERESDIDIATAISGSGPAYVFLLIEMMQEAGHALGLPEQTAAALTRQTVYGAARMARQSEQSPQALRRQVTSPGGTTQAALEVLENDGIRDIFSRAITSARRRSETLAAEFGAP